VLLSVVVVGLRLSCEQLSARLLTLLVACVVLVVVVVVVVV
jgi:hypothetical protein